MEIKPFSSLTELADATRPLLAEGVVALSGGSTYAALLTAWAERQGVRPGAAFFPVDERLVPLFDEASNWGMAKRVFFDPLGMDDQVSHYPESLSHFAALLADRFGPGIPVFDTIFLGIGDDGHTASLFPGTPALTNSIDAVIQTWAPKPPHPRLSLGPATIRRARSIVSVLAGTGKEGIAQRVLEGDISLPFCAITAGHPDHTLWIDARLNVLH